MFTSRQKVAALLAAVTALVAVTVWIYLYQQTYEAIGAYTPKPVRMQAQTDQVQGIQTEIVSQSDALSGQEVQDGQRAFVKLKNGAVVALGMELSDQAKEVLYDAAAPMYQYLNEQGNAEVFIFTRQDEVTAIVATPNAPEGFTIDDVRPGLSTAEALAQHPDLRPIAGSQVDQYFERGGLYREVPAGFALYLFDTCEGEKMVSIVSYVIDDQGAALGEVGEFLPYNPEFCEEYK